MNATVKNNSKLLMLQFLIFATNMYIFKQQCLVPTRVILLDILQKLKSGSYLPCFIVSS
jgi:hypothetical protein